MSDKERVPEKPISHKMIELPEGVRKGGDLLNPATPEPSPAGRLDVEPVAVPAPSG